MGYLINNVPYRVFSAEITQNGVVPPTINNLFQNTIGPINFLYNTNGSYYINSANLFTTGKVFVLFNLAFKNISSEPAIITTQIIDDSNIGLESYEFNSVVPKWQLGDNLINGSLEIRVYN